MPLSTTAKAALCLCPPAMMAGTVATVPAAKRAVHHLTAPRHAHVRPVATHNVARPAVQARNRVDCDPVAPAALPAVPLVTYAAPIPDEPSGTASSGGTPGAGGAIGALAGGGAGVAPLVSPTPTAPPTPAVPEPATWLMMIGGIGAIGMALRRRRTATADVGARPGRVGVRAAAGAALWSGGVAADAGDVAATMAVRSTVAAKSTAAGIAGKALMCVCPAAVVAGGVMTVPPLRQAVHASTAPPIATAGIPVPVPCEGTTVPVSAASLDGFPASVNTVSVNTVATAPRATTRPDVRTAPGHSPAPAPAAI